MRWHKEGVRENEQVMVHPADDKSWKVLEGPEKATGGGWMGTNQNSSRELALCPEIDPTPLSSNSAKTA
jgi:hypothetical protein